MITPRFFALALISPALLLLSLFAPILIVVGVLYGVTMIALAVLDRQRAGNASQLTISRQHDEKLSLGVLNRIVLRVRSSAGRPIAFAIRDEPPALFVGGEDALRSAVIESRDTLELDYTVRPLRRGDFRFGNLNLRWDGPLGLYRRQAVIQAEKNVKVYPDLHGIRKYDLLLRRDRLAEMG
ncbi:MAG TPA: hypothetical protein VKQ72_07655, partial [Aggregatilineales bacterium]|nr:hypothetical protein [Aggregatilineales bacterium]